MSSASIFGLEDHLGLGRVGGRARGGELLEPKRRLHLLLEPLQRPVAAPLHVGGHAGERHDRAHLGTLAGELEVRHVALDPVVIGGERARARELDGPVLAHEPAARTRGSGREQHRYGNEHPEQRDPSHDESLLSIVRPSGHDEELDDGGTSLRFPELSTTLLST